MSGKANVEDISWSRQAYTLRQAIKRCTFPQIMKVVQGYESSDETESLAINQILRINQIHTQTRILATTDKKGRWLSIPLRYAEARFEVLSGGKRSKPMYMREIIDKSLLPQKVQFFSGDELSFKLQLNTNNNAKEKEKFTTLTLHKMYETAYLQGNAIHNNHLDTMVLNVPLHLPVEVVLAEGFMTGSRDRWERYQTLLDKIVSKNVSFELHPGNPHITFFTDKKLESAELQEQYEQITPVGTLFVFTKNDRLRQSKGAGTVLPGPSGARTLSAVSASRTMSPELGIGRDNASVQAGGDRRGRPPLRHAQSDIIGSAATIDTRPRMKSPGRALSAQVRPTSVHATMPRSILKKNSGPSIQGDTFPAPPPEMLANPIHNPMAYVHNNGPQSPPIKQGVRRHSESTDRLNMRAKSPIRADIPRPSSQRVPPDGSPRGSHSSQTSIADSGYSTTSSNGPLLRQFTGALPEPDYDKDISPPKYGGGQDRVDYGSPRVAGQAHAPPPISAIPSMQGVQNGGAPVPAAPPPPPATGTPAPPRYNDVERIRNEQSPRQNQRNQKPPLVKENSRDNMLEELKMKAERRLSRMDGGLPNKVPVFGNKSSPRSPAINSSPRPLNNNKEDELSDILAKRKSLSQSGTVNNNDIKTPPPPAAKPGARNFGTPTSANKFGGAKNSPRGPEVNFSTLAEVPKDLSVLSVSQVCQCLKLMNLDKYSPTFKSNSVDGQLMLQLNKDALKDSFKLSDWDAKRVETFIKGWRPKYE